MVQPTVQDELNETVLMKRKVQPLKKKGKKKKKGSSSKTLTYDEAIKAETQKFSNDDFTLETDFQEFF